MKIAKITYTILLTAFIVFMAVGVEAKAPELKRGGSNDEFHEYIRMANYELKMLEGRFRVNKGESVLEALNRNILEREVSMMEVSPFKEKRISYEEYRRNLINKVK